MRRPPRELKLRGWSRRSRYNARVSPRPVVNDPIHVPVSVDRPDAAYAHGKRRSSTRVQNACIALLKIASKAMTSSNPVHPKRDAPERGLLMTSMARED